MWKMPLRYVLALVTALGCLPCRAAPVTVTAAAVESAADAFVTTGPTGNRSGNNYGSAGALAISAPGSPTGEFQSVVRFDVSVAKTAFDAAYGAGKWTLTGASLTLTAAVPNNAIFNGDVDGEFVVRRMADQTWAEGTGRPLSPTTDGITFVTLPSFENAAADDPLGTFAFTVANAGTTTYNLTPTPGLTSDAEGGTVGFRLAAADASVSYLFNAREFGTATNRPMLALSAVAVPEPAALLAPAVVVVMSVPRRRRRVRAA